MAITKCITVNEVNGKVFPDGHFNLSPRLERRIEKCVVDSVANGTWNLFTAIKKMFSTFCGILIGIVHTAVDALDDHLFLFYKCHKNKHVKYKSTQMNIPSSSAMMLKCSHIVDRFAVFTEFM